MELELSHQVAAVNVDRTGRNMKRTRKVGSASASGQQQHWFKQHVNQCQLNTFKLITAQRWALLGTDPQHRLWLV